MFALPALNTEFLLALVLGAVLSKGFELAVESWELEPYALALLGVAAIGFAGVDPFFDGDAQWVRAGFVALGVGAIALWGYRRLDGSATQ
ncbi:hypothetical protein [Halomicrobium sp. LC1Hm]|uniref:hypothetical protein n=1 Tax=Halomicrobium sp. LC1Hm TaxID=2610902 RepID=UPI001298328F|nr:hypothetical protein [Halomicrobium sp. LC1Hm]QGA82288.1 hypothetical protein LC1Hm_1231 [Halomicrobium sp. LC1Hm]